MNKDGFDRFGNFQYLKGLRYGGTYGDPRYRQKNRRVRKEITGKETISVVVVANEHFLAATHSMAAELWPDESEKSARANIRQAIYRLHSDLAVYHDAKVIDVKSGMLELLDDVHIVTDAEEMKSLYMKAKSTANSDEKAATLKKAFELYLRTHKEE